MNSSNSYLPEPARIIGIKEEVTGQRAIKTFRTQFINGGQFSYNCGQCAMLSVFGKGESMISISSAPYVKDYLQFSILKTGRVTTALHEMEVGDIIGVRGPYGNGFPMGDWKGRSLIFIGGGIGLAPLWGLLHTALQNRSEYSDLMLVYGARTSNDLVYKEELRELKKEIPVHLSVDTEEPGWDEFVGFVPENVKDKVKWPQNSIAITCGPPIMIKFAIMALKEMGFEDERIYTTVENKMKCGIGKCGRCSIGPHYICKDGPVYSWAKLKDLPTEY
ncbi:MAG: heterodisulfide reductase subunit F [Candidatus Aminicenantes bacterium]|nr:heterodisulfide reductase subunit F [Candidatus Aminicenantes bacterium]NIM77673.1 heterodisulfide reductase subunit F [Candidatus Aminicenantes bacterium]NIN16986.1 heterodisulfide reductase subunit F [Candidatus Aminicenantes bacterium]NIN40879.1 heterodisulfide reductase subunit F [Candidatus Aminicenantes bacterium]NIN83684.1 heterodisulfide reductase subunit F [Candidatus Aminicenantes bacterium]